MPSRPRIIREPTGFQLRTSNNARLYASVNENPEDFFVELNTAGCIWNPAALRELAEFASDLASYLKSRYPEELSLSSLYSAPPEQSVFDV